MKHDLCVFVVDDGPMIAYTLSAILREQGYCVIPYTDPIRALREAGQFTPDVLISDVEMPNLGGVDLAVQVQTRYPHCKVLLRSGRIGPIEDLENAREKGFQFPLFAKPVSAQMFAEQLENISLANTARPLVKI